MKLEIVKETVSNTKRPFKDNFVEEIQKLSELDDKIVIDIIEQNINTCENTTQVSPNKKSYGSEWDFLYW